MFKSTRRFSGKKKLFFFSGKKRTKTHSRYFLKWREPGSISLIKITVTLCPPKIQGMACAGEPSSEQWLTQPPMVQLTSTPCLPHVPWCCRLHRGTAKWECREGKKNLQHHHLSIKCSVKGLSIHAFFLMLYLGLEIPWQNCFWRL